MKRVIRIRPGKNEWVQIIRDPAPQPSGTGNDPLRELLFKVGGAIVLFVIACKILSAMLPLLVLGGIGWFFLKLKSK